MKVRQDVPLIEAMNLYYAERWEMKRAGRPKKDTEHVPGCGEVGIADCLACKRKRCVSDRKDEI